MNMVDDVLEDDDLDAEEESDLDYISSKAKKSSPDARRRVEQLMELRRLRQLLGDPDFNGFD
ncbi:PA3496 family putative envelope integrity protein [Sedimenticola sp.]|uniref:PA3496 family putative envelope integrity protein n=1 Tax=Sedimenticola sp. TaxID=1940285 RepID=UPI003D13685A